MSNTYALLGELDGAGAATPAVPVDRRAAVSRQNQQRAGSSHPRAAGSRPRGTPHGSGGRPPKRQFDRLSGTGRPKNELKRDGAGKFNWGSDEQAQEDALRDVEAERAAEAKESSSEPPAPEQPPVQSFDDFRKAQQANRPAEDDKEVRKARADEKFQGSVVVREDSNAAVEEYIQSAGAGKKKERKNKPKKQKQILNLAFKVSHKETPDVPPASAEGGRGSPRGGGRGGRGGRGGPRGGRGGRGGPRGGAAGAPQRGFSGGRGGGRGGPRGGRGGRGGGGAPRGGPAAAAGRGGGGRQNNNQPRRQHHSNPAPVAGEESFPVLGGGSS